MNEVIKVRMVQMRKDPEELSVEMPGARRKGAAVELASSLGREGGLVREQLLCPGHNIVNLWTGDFSSKPGWARGADIRIEVRAP